MDVNKPKIRSSKNPFVVKGVDLTDVTILNTPLPQASSTVEKKQTLQKKLLKTSNDEQNSNKQLNFDDSIGQFNDDQSSLGIIDNISLLLEEDTLDNSKIKGCKERELARKLLQKCSQPIIDSYSITDKENNLNSSNHVNEPRQERHSSFVGNGELTYLNDKNQLEALTDSYNKSKSESLIFEPNEISAKSTELNKSSEKNNSKLYNFDGISFNSNLAELMAQFGDEEFLSQSKANEQFLNDQIQYKKDNLFTPTINNEKDRFDFSCFSGIIGDIDLTLESCMDRKVSVGQFFQRKCGTGYALDAKSPKRNGKLKPLVDDTLKTETSYVVDEKDPKNLSADCTIEPSIMSLSSIAEVLQNVESATPRTLVDHIIQARKKKKQINENVGETYTLVPANRSSLPLACNTDYEKPERDLTQSSLKSKLSLDSKTFGNLNPKLKKLLDMNIDDTICETSPKKSLEKIIDQQTSKKRSSCSDKDISNKLSVQALRDNNMTIDRQTLHNSKFGFDKGSSSVIEQSLKSDLIGNEKTLVNSTGKLSFENSNIQIKIKTPEITTCIVNVPRDIDLEIFNEGDRWILCNLKINLIQEEQNIKFELPDEEFLMRPNFKNLIKIGVNVTGISKIIIAKLEISMTDMVTKNSKNLQHMLCFVTEELSIEIDTENNMLDFQTIMEDSSKSLPITFYNKNNIDIPISLKISQESPCLFSVGQCLDDTVTSCNQSTDNSNFYIKSQQKMTVNIDFKGMSLQSLGEQALRSEFHKSDANLYICLCFKENQMHKIKTISLTGCIGVAKLVFIDTQFPIVIQPRLSKMINLFNSGNIDIEANAIIVNSKDDLQESRDFNLCPNNIYLRKGEKLSMQILYKPESKTNIEKHGLIKLSAGNKVSFYPIIGEKDLELTVDSFLRPETPQRMRSVSSPTSPHSLVFNKSGNSGRHSPGSTVSIGTTIPLRASHTSLVWGSIKTGKSDTKRITIRNTSNSKLKLSCTIHCNDQNFKFLKDSQLTGSSMTITLQGMESKTLSVIFSPNNTGAAAGKILFSHYMSKNSGEVNGPMKTIQLYGYGGVGKIEISKALKDTSGQMWLSLGKLNSEGMLQAKIKLHNSGDLPCFAKVKLTPKVVHPSTSNWHIEPTELLLNPKVTQWINLEFRPRKNDLSSFKQTNVVHVGTLKITSGDEPTRLRLRRLYNKLKETGQISEKLEADEFRDVVYPICKAFPGEIIIPDLKHIRDSVQNLGDLCEEVTQMEVKLIIEINADETLSMLQEDMDDSQSFYSLCSDGESMYGGESFLPTD